MVLKSWLLVALLGYVQLAFGTKAKATTKELCIDYAKHINHHHPTESYTSVDDPRGTWVSTRCEIIPGEKYVFRRFLMEKESWSGKIYHYHDSWCSKPKFTVKFDGAYVITTATATTHSQTSFSSRFDFSNISFRADSEDVVKDVFNFLLKNCPTAVQSLSTTSKLKDFVGKHIAVNDSDLLKRKQCRYFLGLHPYSYKKIRMVKDATRMKYQTLFFGDIPRYATKHMRKYIPNEFQYGLARIDRPWCTICQLAQSDQPPVLPVPEVKNNFATSWVTETCLATTDRQFETDYYEFEPLRKGKDEATFNIYQAMFMDPDCKNLKFDFKAGGIYYALQGYEKVPDVSKIKMAYTWMSITPYDQAVLQLIKSNNKCGNSEEWKLGVEQNVTITNGCFSVVPIVLPFVADVILRASTINKKRELYLEQIEDGLYFQNNLVTCEKVTSNLMMKKTTSRPTPVGKVTLPTRNEVLNEQIDRKLREQLEETIEKEGKRSGAITFELHSFYTFLLVFLWMPTLLL